MAFDRRCRNPSTGGEVRVGDEQRGRVDPLWWGIALALAGVFGGLILMLAG